MTLSLRTALATVALFACASSQAVTLVGLNSQNQLSRFDTVNIAGASYVDITGLSAGDRLVGIDLRPKDGKIYGVSLSNQIYTVNEWTGAATWVAALSSPVIQSNLGYGIDFNPVADFGTGASLRLVSSAGDNFAINAATGSVGNAANKIVALLITQGFHRLQRRRTSRRKIPEHQADRRRRDQRRDNRPARNGQCNADRQERPYQKQ